MSCHAMPCHWHITCTMSCSCSSSPIQRIMFSVVILESWLLVVSRKLQQCLSPPHLPLPLLVLIPLPLIIPALTLAQAQALLRLIGCSLHFNIHGTHHMTSRFCIPIPWVTWMLFEHHDILLVSQHTVGVCLEGGWSEVMWLCVVGRGNGVFCAEPLMMHVTSCYVVV